MLKEETNTVETARAALVLYDTSELKPFALGFLCLYILKAYFISLCCLAMTIKKLISNVNFYDVLFFFNTNA